MSQGTVTVNYGDITADKTFAGDAIKFVYVVNQSGGGGTTDVLVTGTTPVTHTSTALAASASGTIPAGAKEWTFTVLTGTATLNGVAGLPAGFSDSSDKTTAVAIAYTMALASTGYVRYAT